MLAQHVNPHLLDAINQATTGKLKDVQDHCAREHLDLDLSVLTFLEGLPDREMRLCVTGFGAEGTKLFIQAALNGAARTLGWNLYLSEKVSDARSHLAKGQQALQKIDEATAQA